MSNRKIVIVDDEAHIRALLEQTLEDLEDELDAEILSASDGAEGLALIREERPKLVFLDVMMPQMNGYEVCRAVTDDDNLNGIHVILLTAKGQDVDRERGIEAGAKRYMTKPFDPDEVFELALGILQEG